MENAGTVFNASETVIIPQGQTLVVTPAAGSTGYVSRLGDKAGQQSQGTTPLTAGVASEFGPFTSDARFQVVSQIGSITYAIGPDNTVVAEDQRLADTTSAGTKSGATVRADEKGAVIHETTFTLTNTPLTLADDAGVGQWATVKLYDFPAGNIVTLGAVLDADIALTETWWVDTITGSFGVGSAPNTDASTIATTRQNIIPVTNIAALVAQAGPVTGQSTGSLHSAAAAGTDLDLNLNIKIADNAAHCPNLVSNGTFGSDTVWTKGTGWTIGTGVATSDGSQTDVSDLEQALSNLTDGVTFAVSFDLTRTAGSVTPILGGTAGTTRSTDATHAENIIAGSTDDKIILRASADFEGTVDNVTVTALAGTGTITGTLKVIWMNAGDIA